MSNNTSSMRDYLPLISVILPVWNPRADWLAAAIDSAFHESHCQIELILVDDGSDKSPDAWMSAEDTRRVRLIQHPHTGVGHARNVALSECRGDFVRFLDGDDLFLPESTSMLLEFTRGELNTVAYGATILSDPSLKPQGIARSRMGGCIHFQTALGRFSSTIPALLIPRQAAVQVGFDERLVVQGDWDFVLRLSEIMDFQGTTQPVYIYRRHGNSHSTNIAARREAVRSTVLIVRGYLERHPELRGTRAERRIRAYAQFLISKLRNQHSPINNRRFWMAVSADPVRGLVIAGTRTAAAGLRSARKLVSRFLTAETCF